MRSFLLLQGYYGECNGIDWQRRPNDANVVVVIRDGHKLGKAQRSKTQLATIGALIDADGD